MTILDWKDSILLLKTVEQCAKGLLKSTQISKIGKNLETLGDLSDAYTDDILQVFADVIGFENNDDMPRAILEGHFLERFSHVRLYHACRPISLEPYHQYGILKTEQVRLENEARQFFSSIDESSIFKSSLEKAIEEYAEEAFPEHEQKVFLVLDDRVFLKDTGHYLIYGSEYLLSIAAKIEPYSPKYQHALRKRGIPTIISCDVPVLKVGMQLSGVWRHLLVNYLFSLREKNWPQDYIDYTITLDHVPPNQISGHSHPLHINDPHEGFRPYKSEKIKCTYCKYD